MKILVKKMVLLIYFFMLTLKIFSADTTMTYIHNSPESELDKRYKMNWEILRTALERTELKYGPYKMFASERMTENRQVYELEHSTGKITIMCLGSTPEYEKKLYPIRIPVDKNLNGYEVFLIRKDDADRFKNVKTLNDLKQFRFGLGLGWIDAEILKSNGFKVVTGSNYEGLFEMLLHKRFDLFLRSADEILAEYEARKDVMPDLLIEKNLLINYELPIYFWFSNNPKGRHLAARVEEGLRMMIADNTFDQIFSKHENEKIKKLNLINRKIFKINNPFLSTNRLLLDKRLLFDPRTYVVPPNVK